LPTDLAFDANDPDMIVLEREDRSGIAQGGGIYSFAGPTLIADCQINYNTTSTSGGGIYFAGGEYSPTTLRNCLVTNNSAVRDGGGISNNWQNELEILNCTIADNALTGVYSFGGGLYGSYESNAVVSDSIIWNNSGSKGSQIALVSDDPADPMPSSLKISHSDIDLKVSEATALIDANTAPVIRTGFNQFMLPGNNDLASGIVDIGFNINYFGMTTSTLYVNNNGNVSLDAPLWAFTPDGLSSNIRTSIIAPFFADVDTREGGMVTYGAGMVDGREAFGFNWINVGYFATNVDKLNSFQLILIDRSDRAPGDFDIEFNYRTINWESGDISYLRDPVTGQVLDDPNEGIGGASARVGFSNGTGNPGTYYEFEGSGVSEAFLDSNPAGLVNGSRNSTVPGRYIFSVLRGALDIEFMDIPVYVEDGSTIDGWEAGDPLDPSAPSGLTNYNIAKDPVFVAGYYLGQIASGQKFDSPCVDIGSANANDPDIGLGDYTTRTDSVNDVDIVDLGYHYDDGILGYRLTATVIADPNDPNNPIHGYIDPNDKTIYVGVDNNVVTLVAYPDKGYQVKQWTGTDDDTLTDPENTVTLTEDKQVTVEFEPAEQPIPVVINVPGDYQTIQDAVNAADDGDTIVVDTGVHYGGYQAISLLIDKSVHITSRDPQDPCTVDATILRGFGGNLSQWNNLGVVFGPNTDPNTILNGFTIEGFGGFWADGDNGDRSIGHPNGGDGTPGLAAGIIIDAGASPTIKNCVIRNNFTVAGNGGNGVGADNLNNAGRGGWAGWAHGAGIYCGPYSNPKLINCRIEDNSAYGGNGGNGGDWSGDTTGGQANYGGNYSRANALYIPTDPNNVSTEIVEGDLWELWDWDFADVYWPIYGDPGRNSYIGDYRWYSGYGGGVYCEVGSNVEFEHCEIRGNRTYGGMSGQGGVMVAEGRQTEPLVPYEIPSYGGGVYCAANSTAIFNGCTFEDNVASETITDPNHRINPYIGYGGGISAERSAIVFITDCNFVDNQADSGGAIYVSDADMTIRDCNIASNEALRGGGFFGFGGSIDMISSIVANNQVITDVNDPNDDEVLSIGAGLCFWSVDATIRDCNIIGNRAEASGGGLYLRGENESQIRNCLIINNAAGRDGGGISINWYAMPEIANCTFTGNAASGTAGETDNTGFGGALYCGYESDVTISDSILWNNFGLKGQEIAVGASFETVPKCKVTVKYSDVKASPDSLWVDIGCELSLESSDGNINVDPLFVSGPEGRYYLSQAGLGYDGLGQSLTSPCIDSGSDYASHVGLLGYTTRTDIVRDKDKVDMGYHYNIGDKCRLADFVFDGVIDLSDFNIFEQLAEKWLEGSCSEENDWCDSADIRTDGQIDEYDLYFLVNDCNNVADINAPIPDPSEWDIEPYMSSSSSVSMVAETAFDAWSRDVQYEFDCITPGGHDSDWQDSSIYTDRGLIADLGYGYRVRSRDKFGNVTEWSEIRYSGIDTTPPAPAPRIETIDANSTTSISMVATIAYDDSDVEYYFENVLGDVNDSGWQDEPNYTAVDLDPNTEYGFRVKARDKSASQNETDWSEVVYATTLVPADTDPPLPDPMEWDLVQDANGFDGTPREVYGGGGTFDYYAQMTAVIAIDGGGGVVEYYFECTTEHGFDSGWVIDPIYSVLVGRIGQGHRFRVRARDQAHNMTAWSPEDPAD